MAEPYFVIVSPHNFNSTTVGLAATLQVSTCIPNFLITEYFVNLEEFGNDIAVNPFKVKDGYIQIPTGPALESNLTRTRWPDTRTNPSRPGRPGSISRKDRKSGRQRQFSTACATSSTARWISSAVVYLPVEKRSVPMAYSSGTRMACNTLETST